jgi:hypothetical protein
VQGVQHPSRARRAHLLTTSCVLTIWRGREWPPTLQYYDFFQLNLLNKPVFPWFKAIFSWSLSHSLIQMNYSNFLIFIWTKPTLLPVRVIRTPRR